MVAKKPEVTRAFINKVLDEKPDPDEGPRAYLDWALPLYRSIQSAVNNGEAQLAFLNPSIFSALKEIERMGEAPEHVAKARRTMGMLTPNPKPIGKKDARSKAAKIRRAVTKVLGPELGKKAVTFERKVTVKVEWDLVAKGGRDLLATVRRITGLNKSKVVVGKATKRALTGEERRWRG